MTADSRISAARAVLRARDDDTIAEQIRIASIPAPTGAEAVRGAYLATRFREIGLERVSTDEIGNVIGYLPTTTHGDAPLIVAAHLDTVFEESVGIHPRIRGERILAPGITDNARGLAALVAIAAAMREAEVVLHHPIVFVGTVGEEGTGDLRGVKHLMREGSSFRRAAAFIAIDGPGSARIVNQGIGSRRFRATVTGSGGHSWGDRGTPNPVNAIANAIVHLQAVQEQVGEVATVSVGRVGGGSSVNSIPREAWIEIDLRAQSEERLADLEARAREILSQATHLERGRLAGSRPLELMIERIGNRPCGETPSAHPLVLAAAEATRTVGEQPELAAASTDANLPMSLAIPAITLGAGGRGGGIHTPDEWFENHDGPRGIERVLLTVMSAAGG